MEHKQVSDEQLVRQYVQGDEAALELLIRRHRQRVFGAIYMFVRDRYLAEDLFQDTFMKAIRKLRAGAYQEEGKFLPWILRIAHNRCIDYYRKTQRTPAVVTTDGYDLFEVLNLSGPAADRELMKTQSHQAVRELVERLPAEQREVVILRIWADLSFKEIAELTGVSINTALGRMRYALINLRKLKKQLKLSL
ncbi:MAG: sigma-70 family RNA polymerase sigma factor [Chitinophagales bacterium]|nr:sigma-70 family RNA polymerase sigma factor [Chitinophagales bacterium]MDW8393809.1 sigma-70 family RNA polymerase sigma factor [Chitinophagales bacterium]